MTDGDDQIIQQLKGISKRLDNQSGGGGIVNTGNATTGDVASGKTFSSSALTNATGTSTKNATVPEDAPIQPPQAFVDNVAKFADASTNIAVANQSITHFSGTLFGQWLSNAVNFLSPPIANFSGNALDLTSVNSILAAGVELAQIFNIDVSGGTNAAPLLPVFTMDFGAMATTTGEQYGTARNSTNNASIAVIDFDGLYGNLADTHIAWDGNTEAVAAIEVGVLDTPTKQQIIDKLVAIGGGKITDLGNLVIRIAPTDHNLEPIDFAGYAPTVLTQGTNAIGTLRSIGCTVTTN